MPIGNRRVILTPLFEWVPSRGFIMISDGVQQTPDEQIEHWDAMPNPDA